MSTGPIVFCLVIGGLLVFNYYYSGSLNRTISTWPKTKGKILSTDVRVYKRFEYGGDRCGLGVKYEFYVDGKRYESDKVYTTHTEYRFSGDSATVAEFSFINDPQVMYNPANPNNCCLLAFPSGWVATLSLVLGVCFSIAGLIGLAFKIWG